MNLKEVRWKMVQLSGRYDLVSSLADPYTDNGANFLIQAGSRYLDRLYGHPKEWGSVYETLTAGTWYATFQNSRAIQQVWCATSTDRYQLEEKDLDWLKAKYDDLISQTSRDDPVYYATAMLRSLDDTDKDAQGSFFDYVLDDSDDYSGVVVLPPPESAVTIEVVGRWYSDALTADDSENYWSENFPETLIKAALYEAEVFNRNRQGQNDWLDAIERDAIGIDKDTVAEQVANSSKMRG